MFEIDLEAYWYLILRGVSRFYSYHNRFPGAQDSDVESDIPSLRVCFFCFKLHPIVDQNRIMYMRFAMKLVYHRRLCKMKRFMKCLFHYLLELNSV